MNGEHKGIDNVGWHWTKNAQGVGNAWPWNKWAMRHLQGNQQCPLRCEGEQAGNEQQG